MRDLHVDSLKGFLILAVLWGHIGLVRAAVPGNISSWIPVEELLNAQIPVGYFHMALFFAVSILFVKSIHFDFIKKCALLLLMPYVFWYLWTVQNLFILDTVITLKKVLWGNWPHVTSILWFLPACFTVNIYFALYRKYTGTYWVAVFWLAWLVVFLYAEPIAAVYHPLFPFGIDLTLYLFPLLVTIDYIYRHKQWFQKVGAWWALALLSVAYGCIRIIDVVEPIKTYTPFAYRIDLAQFTVPFTPPGLLAMLLNKTALWQSPKLYFMLMFLSIPVIVLTAIGCSKLFSKLSPYAKYIGMVQ